MRRNGQANLAIDFKATGWCQEAEHRWFERIGGRKNDSAMVIAICEGGGWRTAESEVPIEEVRIGGWSCVVVGRWRRREFLCFADFVVLVLISERSRMRGAYECALWWGIWR